MTHFIADFTDGKQLRLFTRRQTIVAHAGLAKLLRHFGKVPGVVINPGAIPISGSGSCACAGRVVSLAVSAQTGTPGNSRRKVNVGNKRNDTAINRVCASSQKWIEVLVYRFSCSRSPVGNSVNKLKPVG